MERGQPPPFLPFPQRSELQGAAQQPLLAGLAQVNLRVAVGPLAEIMSLAIGVEVDSVLTSTQPGPKPIYPASLDSSSFLFCFVLNFFFNFILFLNFTELY